MDLGYTGNVALVTGGTRGIGLAIARALLDEGCWVAITGRSAPSLSKVSDQLGASGSRVVALEGDLAEDDVAGAFVDKTVDAFGAIDIVVNNAASFTEGHVLGSPVDGWVDLFRLKLVGYLEVVRAAVPHMRARRSGCVLNVAGVAGFHPYPGSGHAGVVNAGVLNLTRLLAKELAGDGIRVNALSPGSVRTDRMHARVSRLMAEQDRTSDEIEQMLAERVPTGQSIEPDEVALIAVAMCSPRLTSLLGNNVVIDGGVTL